jgi:hypothetical protein
MIMTLVALSSLIGAAPTSSSKNSDCISWLYQVDDWCVAGGNPEGLPNLRDIAVDARTRAREITYDTTTLSEGVLASTNQILGRLNGLVNMSPVG